MDAALCAVHDLRAFWYLETPVEPLAFQSLLERAIRYKQSLQKNNALKRDQDLRFALDDLAGTSPAMQQIFSLVRQVAPTSAPVLIRGESGTGKELVAREIHKCSRRGGGPFVAINAVALPDTLVESELFGHEKGAFTGAMDRSTGCFEQAHGGTLFLDEIGEMPPSVQPKLLRVLEDLRVRRLGGKHESAVDARILAATSQELGMHLREELYYRLSVFQIVVPPLRHLRQARSGRRHFRQFAIGRAKEPPMKLELDIEEIDAIAGAIAARVADRLILSIGKELLPNVGQASRSADGNQSAAYPDRRGPTRVDIIAELDGEIGGTQSKSGRHGSEPPVCLPRNATCTRKLRKTKPSIIAGSGANCVMAHRLTKTSAKFS
jgi:hypothetical protein